MPVTAKPYETVLLIALAIGAYTVIYLAGEKAGVPGILAILAYALIFGKFEFKSNLLKSLTNDWLAGGAWLGLLVFLCM